MRVSISQPAYLPWLGYFNRIANSDIAVVLDDVMLERSSTTRFTNRNKILTATGPAWLTVPIIKSGVGQPLISQALIDKDQNWQEKHRRSIAYNYTKAPYFSCHENWLGAFYGCSWTHLSPLLAESTSYLLGCLGISTPLVYSSQLNAPGSKSELILNICLCLGATTYISGPLGRNYLELDSFSHNGISIIFDEYSHPRYCQSTIDFHPRLSVLDLLFNCGDDSMGILFSQIKS